MKIEFHLSNYATKSDFKKATRCYCIDFFKKKVDLVANLKSDVHKLDIDKFKHILINLSNLKNKVYELDVDKLVPVLVDLNKLSDVGKNVVVTKDVYNAKITNIEHKISHITNLATNATLNTVENKIPNICNLLKKSEYNTKFSQTENEIMRNI